MVHQQVNPLSKLKKEFKPDINLNASNLKKMNRKMELEREESKMMNNIMEEIE